MKSSDCFRPFSFCMCTCNFSVVSLWGAEFHSKEARQWTVRVDPSSPPTLHLPPIRHHPVHQHSWLWFIYRWNYLVLRFDASHCQSNFILHSKPFCTAPRRDKNLRFGFHFLFVLLFSFFFCIFFFFCFRWANPLPLCVANFSTNVDLGENWLCRDPGILLAARRRQSAQPTRR